MCQNQVDNDLAKFSFRTSDFRCGTAKSEKLAVVHFFLLFKLAFGVGVGLKMAPIFKTPCCKFFLPFFSWVYKRTRFEGYEFRKRGRDWDPEALADPGCGIFSKLNDARGKLSFSSKNSSFSYRECIFFSKQKPAIG